MAKFKPYAVTALPTTGIDPNGIYFRKGVSDAEFTIYIRNNANTEWISGGTGSGGGGNFIETINGLTGPDAVLDLDFTNGILSLIGSTVNVDLDDRYALDNAVVKLAANQTITGDHTYTGSLKVKAGSDAHEPLRKEQVDSLINNLQNQIDVIDGVLASGLKYIGDIDASTNPNYPAAEIGDTYVISVAGKIGGAPGVDVHVGNTIIAKADTAAGTHAAVGSNWTILQADLDYATTTVPGIIQIATSPEVNAAANNTKVVTPMTLAGFATANIQPWAEARYIRYDIDNQTLTTLQKTNARTNIDAVSVEDVEWGAKEW